VNAEWMLTLAPVAGLAANVFAQIACARILRRLGLSIVAGALCGLLVTALCTALDSTSAGIALAADWAVAILTYFALAFGYWAFLNLNITSLRIRILREFCNLPEVSPATNSPPGIRRMSFSGVASSGWKPGGR